MAFSAEDVHLLATARVDGRFFLWNFTENPDEKDNPQVLRKNTVVAIHTLADGESVHRPVCWHPHKQEVLMVAIGNRILKIDRNRVGKAERFSSEEPLKCSVDNLINGVQFVGKHDGEITELSMCQWLTARLASASTDGAVKIWDERKATPLAVLRPYHGQPINPVTFSIGPRPQHIVFITGGPLNREVKIWASAEEGWLLPSDVESWKCTQTLELKSSAEHRLEDVFFNQVVAVALNRAGLFLLANAKKDAIYAVHIEYGPNQAATRMGYIAEFTVTMPIFNLTGTSDGPPDGKHIVQVHSVQTQAIQQYALDLSQCLPPPLENAELEKTDSNTARAFDAASSNDLATLESSHGRKSADMHVSTMTSLPAVLSSSTESVPIASRPESLPCTEVTSLPENASGAETRPSGGLPSHGNADDFHTAPPPLPSPWLCRKMSGFRSPSNGCEPSPQPNDLGGDQSVIDYSDDHRSNTAKEKKVDVPSTGDNLWKADGSIAQNDISMVRDPPVGFNHPTHLLNPSEILSSAASSKNSKFNQCMAMGEAKVQDVNNDAEGTKVEIRVVGDIGVVQNNEFESRRESHTPVAEKKEKFFYSQASDLSIQLEKAVNQLEKSINSKLEGTVARQIQAQFETSGKQAVQDALQSSIIPAFKISCKILFERIDATFRNGLSKCITAAQQQIDAINSVSSSLPILCRELADRQRKLSAVAAAGANTKAGNSTDDNLWKADRSVARNGISMVPNPPLVFAHPIHLPKPSEILAAAASSKNYKFNRCMNMGEAKVQDVVVKNDGEGIDVEVKAVGETRIGQTNELECPRKSDTPVAEEKEKSFCSQAFDLSPQLENAMNQLEKSVNSKLEGTIARQIQAQFETSGKQALRDALQSSIIPALETSCKAMFDQIDATFQQGLSERITAAQQQVDATNSASSNTPILSGELADGQRKFLAVAAAGANPKAGNSSDDNLWKADRCVAQNDISMVRDPPVVFKHPMHLPKPSEILSTAASSQNYKFNQCMNMGEAKVQDVVVNNDAEGTEVDVKVVGGIGIGQNNEFECHGECHTPVTEKKEKFFYSQASDLSIQLEKAVNQLEKSISSKLEGAIARQIQAQLETSGKQALRDALRSSSIIPAFATSCKAMFGQIDATFQKGLSEHITAAQQQLADTHSSLAITLRDAINSASSITQIAAAGANSTARNSTGDNLWKVDRSVAQNDISVVGNPPLVFKHPTRLLTPAQILVMAACPKTSV